MIKALFSSIWKFIDAICFIAGFAAIVYGLFVLNVIAGWIGLGVVLLIAGYISETLPKNNR